jgi:hypothetical protein
VSDPIELLERRIRSVVSGEENSRGLHFFCQIGGRDDVDGITTLQISGSGWALLSWRVEHETDMYSFQMNVLDLRRFYEVLHDYPFWSVTPRSRERHDEEINIHMRVSDQRAGTSNGTQFWTHDMVEFSVLSELMKRVLRLVDLLSGGEVSSMPS